MPISGVGNEFLGTGNWNNDLRIRRVNMSSGFDIKDKIKSVSNDESVVPDGGECFKAFGGGVDGLQTIGGYYEFAKRSGIQISEHFNSDEFDCKCSLSTCSETKVSELLVGRLELLRAKLGRSLKLNSAYRCKEHNKAIGGAKNSQHMHGNAADVHYLNIEELIEKAPELVHLFAGIGFYSTFTHLDVRGGGRACWLDF